MTFWISKSSYQLYKECPGRWKRIYIDKIQEPATYPMIRGRQIHKKIEDFYKHVTFDNVTGTTIPNINSNIEIPSELSSFINFQKERIIECMKDGAFNTQLFLPVFTEKWIDVPELKIRGIVDAVFINPADNEYIVIDWKSGKPREAELTEKRKELAFYKYLIDESKILDKPIKYWGEYFVDHDKLFFEEAKQSTVDKIKKEVKDIQEEIDNTIASKKDFPYKTSFMCNWCGLKDTCPAYLSGGSC